MEGISLHRKRRPDHGPSPALVVRCSSLPYKQNSRISGPSVLAVPHIWSHFLDGVAKITVRINPKNVSFEVAERRQIAVKVLCGAEGWLIFQAWSCQKAAKEVCDI